MSIGTLFSSLLAIIISLAFVIALAWGTLWLLKRFQDGSFGRLSGADDGPEMRFEKALPVGPRERLVLVEVEGEQMLLGVTAHAITPLKSWPVSASSSDKVERSAGADTATADTQVESRSSERRFRLRMAKSDPSLADDVSGDSSS